MVAASSEKRRILEDLPSNDNRQIEAKNKLHAESESAIATVKALADALIRPDAPIPTRVVGVWPMVGRSLSLEVRPADLERAMGLVLGAADATRQATASPAAPVEEGACLQVA